ncbi:MmcQ/YjbR family DNA-binding protein [Polyangium aurulentum]|uniref:MmcQ/YjbR family DNA-binding protein n=1 Tax=Polyangium aurulentum TaxID=2567896 RepID=UPI0010AEB182|nr:MmcQ/YjbR family DNA-binding protein [Polyangium aurulentum]UQA60611.1 MmcQ/YjbR family DNA-binding protein [Polyangium aurulentum]
MKWEKLCELGRELPEVVEDIWFRTPALKVRGKAMCRLREEGDTVVFLTENVEEQEFLIQTQPDIYYITDHYRGWPAVLARLATLTVPECRLRLERAWRVKAPKRLLAQLDGEAVTASARAKKPTPTPAKKPKEKATGKKKAGPKNRRG